MTQISPAQSKETTTNPIIAKQLDILESQAVESFEPSAKMKSETLSSGPINLRVATATELESLPGIGEKRAEQIIALRDIGEISSVEDLEKIKGIGSKSLTEIVAKVVWE